MKNEDFDLKNAVKGFNLIPYKIILHGIFPFINVRK